jgi:valyl-tRNA synthetase
MSKSLGNSPDPLDLIEKYGADGLRHGIMSIAPKGSDIRFAEERIEQGRNFCNKLWNVSRFRTLCGSTAHNLSSAEILSRVNPEQLKDEDHAILISLKKTIAEVAKAYDSYEFNTVLHSIYKFFWTDFCDWYVENSKNRVKDENSKETCLAIQDLCLREILLLLHPFTPFITEELWTLLGFSDGHSIQGVHPTTGDELIQQLEAAKITLNPEAEKEMAAIRELVTQLRALKAERNLSSNRQVEFFYVAEGQSGHLLTKSEQAILEAVGAKALHGVESSPAGLPAIVSSLGSFYLDLSSGVNVEEEKARISKEIENLQRIIQSIENKLKNEKFVSKAPEAVVAGAQAQLAENQAKLKESEDILNALSR